LPIIYVDPRVRSNITSITITCNDSEIQLITQLFCESGDRTDWPASLESGEITAH
jgi:hypothetical protein